MYKSLTTFSDFHLNETLKTHDIRITKDNVLLELSLLNYNFSLYTKNNKIYLTLHHVSKTQIFTLLIENLSSLMINRHGWFPSSMYIRNISGASNLMKYDQDYLIDKKNYFSDVTIIYEPKYDIESEIPRYLYHLSIQEFNDKILKFGLVPKSKNKLSKHLDRIYVCKDPNDCKHLINRMLIHYVHKYEDKLNLKWIIYKIDTDGLNLKLFKDPNYNDGYYLVDNIPPNNLSVFDKE
jgi:hypothetical protein